MHASRGLAGGLGALLVACGGAPGKTDVPFAYLANARVGHTATLLTGGEVLIAGGWGLRDMPGEAELFDPVAGTFSTIAYLPTPRVFHTATLLLDGKVLIAGGEALGDPGDNWPVVASAVLYDPVQRLFVPTGSLATARASHTATLLPDGKVLVAGGAGYETSGTLLLLASAELYDPELGTFTPTGSLPVPCDSHTATLLPSGRVLIAGGECLEGSYGPGETSALYDPASGVFAPSGNLLTAREFHTATVLPPGRDVLIAGGAYWDIPSSAELYESATGAFLATGSMTVDRRFHTATLLPTGKVLFTGGETTSDRWSGIFTMSGPDLASAELYDPSLGVFTPTEQLATGRSGHTATLLLSGDVLIVGGSANGYPLASVEMYDPVAEAFVRR